MWAWAISLVFLHCIQISLLRNALHHSFIKKLPKTFRCFRYAFALGMQMKSDWSSSWRIKYLNTSTWESWFCLKNSEHELYLLYDTYLKQKDGSRVIYGVQVGSTLKTMFVRQGWHSYLNPWTSEGGSWGRLGPQDFENFSKKGCFHGFKREKTNFTTFCPLEKF